MLFGSLCENNDKFAVNRELPQTEIGDLLVIHDTGAHGFSMGYQYNAKPSFSRGPLYRGR